MWGTQNTFWFYINVSYLSFLSFETVSSSSCRSERFCGVHKTTVGLLLLLQKLSANATTCVHDVGSAGVHLRDFATAVSLKNVSIATRELGESLFARLFLGGEGTSPYKNLTIS